jgi:hypothetical protein
MLKWFNVASESQKRVQLSELQELEDHGIKPATAEAVPFYASYARYDLVLVVWQLQGLLYFLQRLSRYFSVLLLF